MNPQIIIKTVKEHTDQLRYLRESIQKQGESIKEALEDVNSATVSLLRDHNETTLEPAFADIHSRITTIETTLEAFIKLVLISDNPDVSEDQYNEIKQVVVDFIAPK